MLTVSGVTLSAGELSLDVPSFVHFDHDAATRKTTLSIENKEEKNQREMWGTDHHKHPRTQRTDRKNQTS
jgi:hypothetical protein